MNMNSTLKCLHRSQYITHLLAKKVQFSHAACTCPNLVPFDLTSKNYSTQRKPAAGPPRRWCSTNNNPPSTKLPPLMQFPEIVWPSLIKSIRNFILATFIIKPYFDRDFNLPDFVAGAKKALEVVSNKLAEGDVKSLDGFISGEIIPKLQGSLSLMSMTQRELIAINKDDIYFSFPYQVGVIFNDDEGADQKRYVEITMVFHSLKGLANMKARGEDPPLNMGMMPEYQKKISICNYRFIREYTKGVDSDWTVNLLNHFKPADHISE